MRNSYIGKWETYGRTHSVTRIVRRINRGVQQYISPSVGFYRPGKLRLAQPGLAGKFHQMLILPTFSVELTLGREAMLIPPTPPSLLENDLIIVFRPCSYISLILRASTTIAGLITELFTIENFRPNEKSS